jgi:uncharacterized membrane protein YhaH (DUF805 family)
MIFKNAVQSGFENYANSEGRSSRSAFWYWILFVVIIGLIAGLLDVILFGITSPYQNGPLGLVSGLVFLIPNICVSIRRLHDTDHSGWWLLISLTGIGILLLVFWYCTKGDETINRFGPPVTEPLARHLHG